MKSLIIVVSLILSITFIYANDSEFNSSGSTIFPVKQTEIEMRKEILSLKKIDYDLEGRIQVDIYFEFYNPGEALTLTIGFVAPPDADHEYKPDEHPKINNFTVIVNNKPLEYKIKYLDSSTFSFGSDEDGRPYFVYYFDTRFNNGINIVQHSYVFQGGNSIMKQFSYEYQVTTGKNWAGGEIKNFELNIDLGPGIHYYPDSFWKDKKNIDWKIVGAGKILGNAEAIGETYYDKSEPPAPMYLIIYIQSGYLSFSAKNFSPDNDIVTGDFNPYTESDKYLCALPGNLLWIYKTFDGSSYDDEQLAKLKAEELDLMHNYLYASKGFVFSNNKVQSLFSATDAYIPNYSLREDDIIFTPRESLLLDKIKEFKQKK